jgi:RNA polymerase sigma-70 factor, ECF subfamily
VTARSLGDAALTAALLVGDPRAPAAAWTSLSPMVRSLLGRYFGPGPERQDLCQDVFLRFFTRIHELRNPRALRAFLIGICLGVAQNALRRDRRRGWLRLTSSGDLPDVAVGPANPEARAVVARLYRVIAAVSADDRALFVTRYVEKLEVGEIAAAMRRPLTTTKRHLARATRRIVARMRRDPALADYADSLVRARRRRVSESDRSRRSYAAGAAARSAAMAPA